MRKLPLFGEKRKRKIEERPKSAAEYESILASAAVRPNTLELTARIVQKKPPGPAELSRSETRAGDERRHCTYWQRSVVLVAFLTSERPTCEWTLKDHPKKRLCYQACVHNFVNQIVIDAMSEEKGMSKEQIVTIFGYLGVKDYAPEPGP